MFKYPKIESLFVRDMNTGKVDPTQIRLPEFNNIKKWLFTEKIDGTNIRIIYQPGEPAELLFRGRTDNAQMPTFLLEHLQKTFTIEKIEKLFEEKGPPIQGICLYGEGYGQKIQKGGGDYNPGNSFRLFDVWIDGYWLEWDSVEEIALKLGICTAPVLFETTIEDFLEMFSPENEFYSEVALDETGIMNKRIEGVVARSYPMMLFRNGIPIKWKLKYSDYKH